MRYPDVMNTSRFVTWTATALAIAMPATLAAQQLERDTPVLSEELAKNLEGYSYKEGPESELEFRGTSIALAASGDIEVEFQEGRARVDVEVEKLANAASLRTIHHLRSLGRVGRWPPQQPGFNRGEGRSRFARSEHLAFAVRIDRERRAALRGHRAEPRDRPPEPRYQRQGPENQHRRSQGAHRLFVAALAAARRQDPADLIQARYALDIAEGAEAGRLATREYTEAEQLLARAEAAQKDKKYSVRNTTPQIAREAVQKAEDARRQAVLALAEERRVAGANAARAEAEAKAASEAALAAEAARRSEAMAADSAAQAAASAAEQKARADLTARLNRALPTRLTDRGIVAEIAGVQFATGAATLNTSAREALARFAGIVVSYPSLKFTVEGHTDITGSDETNRKLSYARGITVRDYLIQQGVDAASISVEGLGPSRPVADNATSEGRARNRRVEIILTGDLVAGT